MTSEKDGVEPELLAAMQHVQAQLDSIMRTGCYGLGFLLDLTLSTLQRRYSLHRLVDEVAALEGSGQRASSTKPASMFRHPPLYGYWHKHHTQARFLARNGLEELKRSKVVEAFCQKHAGEEFTDELVGELAHEVIIGNYLMRHAERRMTGEWIIFAKNGDRNKYVLLASHDDGDANTAVRIQHCEEADRGYGWTWENTKLTVGTLPPPKNG